MDIEALRTFLVLAETKNFTRAASQLFVAQSTVTNRINEIEKELNILLFIRTNRSVELTPEGEQFKDYADKVLKLTNSALAQISSFHKFDLHLRIGCSDSIYEGHLAPLILELRQIYPKYSFKITIGLSFHLLEQLQNNIFDVIFTYLPLNNTYYHCEIFKQDNMVLVTDIANTTFQNGITKQDLITENYLMCNFGLQDVGQFIRSLFPKYHQFSLEIDDCSKIVPFLLGQKNYTFLPGKIAQPYIEAKKLRSIPLIDFETPTINCYMVCKKSKWKLYRSIFM
jgi:DNA-binding transcriptional LysR family regulator